MTQQEFGKAKDKDLAASLDRDATGSTHDTRTGGAHGYCHHRDSRPRAGVHLGRITGAGEPVRLDHAICSSVAPPRVSREPTYGLADADMDGNGDHFSMRLNPQGKTPSLNLSSTNGWPSCPSSLNGKLSICWPFITGYWTMTTPWMPGGSQVARRRTSWRLS